jgi:hypothetical protein
MTVLKAHFDGKVLIPDEPVDLPVNCALEVRVQPAADSADKEKPLMRLLELARQFPVSDWPADGAAEHDHYLYGTPKRNQ